MNEKNKIEKQVKEIIEKENLPVSVDFVLEYWGSRQWKTKRGTYVHSLVVAVNVCNSIYVQRMRRLNPSQNRLFQ